MFWFSKKMWWFIKKVCSTGLYEDVWVFFASFCARSLFGFCQQFQGVACFLNFFKKLNSFSGVCRRKLWFLVFLFIHMFFSEGGRTSDHIFQPDQK